MHRKAVLASLHGFGERFQFGGLTAELAVAGHILGAAIVMPGNGDITITFSSDLGRSNDLLMAPPSAIEKTD